MARLVPTSRVIANGLSITRLLLGSSPKRAMLRSARAWIRATTSGRPVVAEEVGVAPLRPQVVLDRDLAPDPGHLGDLAVLGLEDREEPALLGQPGQPDGVGGRGTASRAGRARGRGGSGRRGSDIAFSTLASRSRSSATVAVAT